MRKLVLLFSLVASLLLSANVSQAALGCSGRFLNPITDTCWMCFFPITIAGAKIGKGFDDFTGVTNPPPICACPMAAPPFIRYGIGITFWSPDRMTEIVKKPMCSPSLGGKVLGKLPTTGGGVSSADSVQRKSQGSFYHAHWMVMPLLQQMAMAADGALCMKGEWILCSCLKLIRYGMMMSYL